MIKAEKQDLEAMRRAALKFRNVGLSRALTTWAVWGAQRALYKQNAFLLASHHAGVARTLQRQTSFRRAKCNTQRRAAPDGHRRARRLS